ncbi:MAG TPA: hypothetical protein VJZ68_03025 [Nitrososphaera sp.]|nr:hypothetical protein [Nitrososphaera sp.]
MVSEQEVLREAITDGLLALGEPIMKTILWHLKAQGVFIDSKNQIDIKLLYQDLEQIVGNIADVVMFEIYDRLKANSLTPSAAAAAEVGTISSSSVLKEIEQLLEIKNGPEVSGKK